MTNFVFGIICILLGIYMLITERKYNNLKNYHSILPKYKERLKKGGVVMIILGLSIWLEVLANYL
ncbi:hypothetical protein BJL95_17135 [Methylomonas sp. LWB]|nr:hypothetical protein BJL95_17135 [Methylomonas sp. LWB]